MASWPPRSTLLPHCKLRLDGPPRSLMMETHRCRSTRSHPSTRTRHYRRPPPRHAHHGRAHPLVPPSTRRLQGNGHSQITTVQTRSQRSVLGWAAMRLVTRPAQGQRHPPHSQRSPTRLNARRIEQRRGGGRSELKRRLQPGRKARNTAMPSPTRSGRRCPQNTRPPKSSDVISTPTAYQKHRLLTWASGKG